MKYKEIKLGCYNNKLLKVQCYFLQFILEKKDKQHWLHQYVTLKKQDKWESTLGCNLSK